MGQGHYGQYSGNHPKFSKKSDEAYDAKQAYDKNLSSSARLHYLENNIADHKSPNHMEGKEKGTMAYMSEEFSKMPLIEDATGGRSALPMHDEFTRSKGITHAPVKMYGGKKGDDSKSKKDYSSPAKMYGKKEVPAKNMGKVLKGKLRK
jgi:hypothetical protein